MVTLTMTQAHRAALMEHLFPDDGCEAVAIALCGRAHTESRHRLVVRRLQLIPYSACSVRRPDCVTWPTELLVPLLSDAAKRDWAIVKIHGHTGFDQFSLVDDDSDKRLFPGVYAWTDSTGPHASAILMRDGRVFGRVVREDGSFSPLDSVHVIGDDIESYPSEKVHSVSIPEFGHRIAQTFGSGTFDRLRALRIAVVGCSGTGSPVIEQLARNCVGTLVLVDPDRVEEKNLNRILNTTMDDVSDHTEKVQVARRAVESMGLGTKVVAHSKSLFDEAVVRDVSCCDVIFGCMDSIDGRYLLNKLATFYLIPYIDLGVKIEADGIGGVDQVCGTVHYLKPDGSSLLSRNLFTLEQVRTAGLRRSDSKHYRNLLDEGYLRGVAEDRPAVIQLNTLIASLAVNELLARLHPYRADPNAEYAILRVSLVHGILDHENDGPPCPVLSRHAGRGDVTPLLDWAELSRYGAAS